MINNLSDSEIRKLRQLLRTIPCNSINTYVEGNNITITDTNCCHIKQINAITTGLQGLYTQTSTSIPVTGTISELSLLDGGVGSLTVPANGFQLGDSFLATLTGHLSSANNQTLRIRIKTDSILLADTGLITMPATTTKHWTLTVNFTIRALGTAGVASIASGGSFIYAKNASNAFEGSTFSVENNTTFNTTISNTLEITAQWGSTNATNSIYSEIFTLTKIY